MFDLWPRASAACSQKTTDAHEFRHFNEQCEHWVDNTFHLLSISPFHSHAAWTIRGIEQKEDWTPHWIIYGVTVNEHMTENDCKWLLWTTKCEILSDHEWASTRNAENFDRCFKIPESVDAKLSEVSSCFLCRLRLSIVAVCGERRASIEFI